MTNTKQLRASRMIHARAEEVFALLADPGQHTGIDGSDMLQGSESPEITAAGQRFVVRMFRDDLGHYRTVNTVVVFEPPTRIAWAPRLDTSFPCPLVDRLTGITTGGHTFTYELREAQDGTEVTEICDWSTVSDPRFEALCPVLTPDDLARTLAKLARAAEHTRTPTALRQG